MTIHGTLYCQGNNEESWRAMSCAEDNARNRLRQEGENPLFVRRTVNEGVISYYHTEPCTPTHPLLRTPTAGQDITRTLFPFFPYRHK